jgi:hypothetical protein
MADVAKFEDKKILLLLLFVSQFKGHKIILSLKTQEAKVAVQKRARHVPTTLKRNSTTDFFLRQPTSKLSSKSHTERFIA